MTRLGGWLRSCFSTPTHTSATFTAVIAIVTTVYAGVSYLQWLALNRANDINAQNIYEIQRPFISVTSIDAESLQTGNVPTGMAFNIHPENGGNTPAEDLVFFINYFIVRDQMTADYGFPDLSDVVVYHGIGAPRSLVRVSTKTFTIPELIEFQRRERFLYIYGRAEYNDRFKNTPSHRTLYCFFLESIGGLDLSTVTNAQAVQPNATVRLNWPVCGRHNCTDEECAKQGFTK